MRLSLLRTALLVASFAMMSFLSGCGGASKGTTTQFYVLNPIETDTSPAIKDEGGQMSIEVTTLRVPQYLERPQIVTRSGSNRLKLAEYHQWGGNLRKNMMRVLAANLSQLLETPNISISSYRSPEPPDFRVELEVLQFEQDFKGQVNLSVQWRLSKGRDGGVIESRVTNLSNQVLPDVEDYEATVSAMSGIYGELSRVISKAILEHASGDPR